MKGSIIVKAEGLSKDFNVFDAFKQRLEAEVKGNNVQLIGSGAWYAYKKLPSGDYEFLWQDKDNRLTPKYLKGLEKEGYVVGVAPNHFPEPKNPDQKKTYSGPTKEVEVTAHEKVTKKVELPWPYYFKVETLGDGPGEFEVVGKVTDTGMYKITKRISGYGETDFSFEHDDSYGTGQNGVGGYENNPGTAKDYEEIYAEAVEHLAAFRPQ